MKQCVLVCGLVFLLACGPAFADQVKVKNGSIVIGDVLNMEEGKLKMKTDFAGEIEIPWDQVVSIETDKPMPVHLGEQGSMTATLRAPEPGRAEIVAASEDVTGTVDIARITAINPPPPPPIQWHGSLVGAYSQSTGNTENLNVTVKGDAKRRTEKDRLTFGLLWNYREDDLGLTERNVLFSGKYDYFASEKLFIYGNIGLQNDRFKDLRVRTAVGTGLGYQFLETDRADFSVEAGLSYVNEDFYFDADDDFVAARFAYDLDVWVIEEWLRFLHGLSWLVNVEDTNDWLLYTDTALRLKITKYWSANAGLIYNYESEPIPGNEKADTTYLLGLAYEF